VTVTFTLNGRAVTWDVAPDEPLLDALRRHGLVSVRRGCDTAACGTCTVLLDGKPVPSCAVPAPRVDGHTVVTVEGAGEDARRLAEALTAEGADQCGWCGPALVLSVLALREENPAPDDAELDHYLAGNLCRCTGYESQRRAIREFLAEKSKG